MGIYYILIFLDWFFCVKNPKPGEIWGCKNTDDSPWPLNPNPKYTVKIIDVKSGWVRFYIDEATSDERMSAYWFRHYYFHIDNP